MRFLILILMVTAGVSLPGCGPRAADSSASRLESERTQREPVARLQEAGEIRLGAPVAVAVNFEGRAFVADASPARLVGLRVDDGLAQEFQSPPTAGFYPADVGVHGFFVYAIDVTNRQLLRFDQSGSFRDVLVNFEQLESNRRVSPFGMAVDETGRVAVTDIENHQVLLINNYLQLDLAFGNYGSYEGQLDTPRGISFSPRGELLVADTGNSRVQYFSDTGTFLRAFPREGAPNPLDQPRRAVESKQGRAYIADPGAGAVFVFTPSGTAAGSFVPTGADRFEPTDVAVVKGRILVTDAAPQSLIVFEEF